ncbi:MAG: DUF3168 domain-containing protein [Candidatus Caldarchaeum sp.]
MRAIDLKEVFKGIVAKFNASTDLKNSVSGLYAYQAPANATFPYIILTMQGNIPWDTMGEGPSGEGILVQFSIFSNKFPDAGEAMNILKLLTGAYDEAVISMSGYTSLRMKRQGGTYLIGQPMDGLFHAPVRYVLTVQKV